MNDFPPFAQISPDTPIPIRTPYELLRSELGEIEPWSAELMRLPGFGPERADLVALMVYDCPRFIFDAYARRLLRQAGYEMGRGY